MALSNYTVRCIKTQTEGEIIEEFFAVVNASYTDDEYARLLVLSAAASAHGF